MIVGIRGQIETIGTDHVVLDLGAVRVRVNTSTQSISTLGSQDHQEPRSPVTMHTSLYMREDLLALYGFATVAERDLFERLITVTGIGPRVAQSLLSVFSPGRLTAAINSDDLTALCQVPGIGRKTAQRLVLELRGKLPSTIGDQTDGRQPMRPPTQINQDLIAALTGLGFSLAEATQALQSVAQEAGVSDEDRLRAAIRAIGTTHR